MADEKPLTSGAAQDNTSELAAIKELFRKLIVFDDNMLPAIVEQYNRKSNVATVRPLISWMDTNMQPRKRQSLANIPVLSLGAGGFHISFPITRGDIGWIMASDRDISQFRQSLGDASPQTGRLHKFEDGMFIPDVFRKYVITGEDEGAMVIQSTDGATRVSVRKDNIKLTAPTKVTIEAPLTTIQGNLQVTGDTELKNTTVNGTDLTSHGHMETNSGRTGGGMVP